MSRLTQLLSLARSLPPSPLRPAGSPQLSSALESIITRAFPIAESSTSTTSTTSTSASPAPPAPSAPTRDLGPSEERAVEDMNLAIGSLRANRALSQFPMTDKTLRPMNDPLYYKRIRDGVHRAQKGQGRSWWRSFFQVKGEA